ncbi:MAG: UDP-glucose/GDP-mannose dehydrogenase family protein [Bdellovibrionales bacterium]
MKIAVIGTGYVGLVAGVCFADAGHEVTCIDNNEEKIKKLLKNEVPIYEPGLQDVLLRSKSRLKFSTDIQSAVEENEIIFSAVGTPEGPDGRPIMKFTEDVASAVCEYANEKKYLVLKSTVPIGTAKKLKAFCSSRTQHEIEIISNPEFLREGVALSDFLKPDRVVIGCETDTAKSLMYEVYEAFLGSKDQILYMDNASAEMCKYAANSFLATKISFINELALLADEVGADIHQVRRGFTSDSRINPAFFQPGLGYGGSCFPKDVKALVKKGEEHDIPMRVVRAVEEANDYQKIILHKRLLNHFGDLSEKTIVIWGLSFKPSTDDVREAPSLKLIEKLLQAGAKVKAYDPVAGPNALAASSKPFELMPDAYTGLEGADALVIVTEWNEFKKPDFKRIKAALKDPIIFDGRNIFDQHIMKDMGFEYYNMGRLALTKS